MFFTLLGAIQHLVLIHFTVFYTLLYRKEPNISTEINDRNSNHELIIFSPNDNCSAGYCILYTVLLDRIQKTELLWWVLALFSYARTRWNHLCLKKCWRLPSILLLHYAWIATHFIVIFQEICCTSSIASEWGAAKFLMDSVNLATSPPSYDLCIGFLCNTVLTLRSCSMFLNHWTIKHLRIRLSLSSPKINPTYRDQEIRIFFWSLDPG